LLVCGFDKGEDVFEGDVTFDVVGGGEDVATGLAEGEEMAGFVANFLRSGEGEGALGGEAAEEDEAGAVAGEEFVDVHDFGLEGVEAVDAAVDEVIEEFVDVAAGVEGDEFSACVGDVAHAFEGGGEEFVPEFFAHEESVLLTPVVAEADGVDVVVAGAVELSDVPIGNGVEELVGEVGGFDEVGEEVFHAAEGPGAFEESEADLEDAEAVGIAGGQRGDVFEITGVEGVGKLIVFEGGFRELEVFDGADVFVAGAVPDDAEDVSDAVLVDGVEEAVVVAEGDDVVLECVFEVLVGVMFLEFFAGFEGEFEVPGDVGGALASEGHADDFMFS